MNNGEWDVIAEPLRERANRLRAEAERRGIRRDFDFRVASADVVCGLMSREPMRVRQAIERMDILLAPHRVNKRRRVRS